MRGLLTGFAFLMVTVASSTPPHARPIQDKPIDLSGTYRSNDGDEVLIKQNGETVTTTFRSRADCPFGGTRDYYLQATLSGKVLTGTMQRCTRSKQLYYDCKLKDPYTAKIILTLVVEASVNMETVIEGKYVPDYLNYDEKGGHYVNCVTKPGGGDPTSFRLERYCTGTYNVQGDAYPGPPDVFPQTPGDTVPCKKCDGIWTLILGRLTTTPVHTGTPQKPLEECNYVYEATWKCPTSGEEQHRRESKTVSGECIVHG